jgi:hypothetical protein
MRVGESAREYTAETDPDETSLGAGCLGALQQQAFDRGHRRRGRPEIDAAAPALGRIAKRAQPLPKTASHAVGTEKRGQDDDRMSIAARHGADIRTERAEPLAQHGAPLADQIAP